MVDGDLRHNLKRPRLPDYQIPAAGRDWRGRNLGRIKFKEVNAMSNSDGRIKTNVDPEGESRKKIIIVVIVIIIIMVGVYFAVNRTSEETPTEPVTTGQTVQ